MEASLCKTLLRIYSIMFVGMMLIAVNQCLNIHLVLASPDADTFAVQLMLIALVSFPFMVVFSVIGAWMAYHQKNYQAALACIQLPSMNIMLGLLGAGMLEVVQWM